MNKTTPTDLINILEPIPDRLWCVGNFTQQLPNGELAHCVMGHLGETHQLFQADELPFVYAILDYLPYPSNVNDGTPYKKNGKKVVAPGSTPKERVINALRECVKEGI